MQYSKDELNEILRLHGTWLRGERDGKRANLTGADLTDADLRYADLADANLTGTDLRGANLTNADMRGADLRYADLRDADLRDANLNNADLRAADLTDADLTGVRLWGTVGNMREIKSMQLERWNVTYTHDRLQIGCKNYAIEDWKTWRERPEWIARMDVRATEWAEKYLDLVLSVIAASPAEVTA
jgi:uncharacterized protein YjbI with pentapeptide repeats